MLVSLDREQRKTTYKCIGSHANDVTHFVCPLIASPIGFPVLGSHSRTYTNKDMSIVPMDEDEQDTHDRRDRLWPTCAPMPPILHIAPNLYALTIHVKESP